MAAQEKNRLEEKQRAMRKYMEKVKKEHKTAYFDEWNNPDDDSVQYYRYNHLYWEKDRKCQEWGRLPDLYSEKLPAAVEEILNKS